MSGLEKIHLVLTDDWELRGDGSGEMRRIQFETLRQLRRIYEEAGIRGTFNVEVMQQLHHLRHGREHPRLLELAREWSELVRETYARGHDVQLHVHPQWQNAAFLDGRWRLTAGWSLARHAAADAREMVESCKQYLEELLQPVDASYRVRAFRSGQWCIAPSEHLLTTLAELGIQVDLSVAPGLVKRTDTVEVDHRGVDEPFLPYYPDPHDARRTAATHQPIVCCPTFTFRYTPGAKWRDLPRRASGGAVGSRGPSALKGWVRYHATGTHYVSDLSQLDLTLMRRMLADLRSRARTCGARLVPAVFTNHTKDLVDFEPIRRFAADLAAAEDVEVITTAELAQNLRAGVYPVRARTGA